MRRTVVGIVALAVLLGVAAPAPAGWVWRDGKWVYQEPSPPPPRPAEPPRESPERPPRSAEPESSAASDENPAAEKPRREQGDDGKPEPIEPSPAPAEPKTAVPEPPPPRTETDSPSELPDSQKPARPKDEKKPFWDRVAWWKNPPEPGRDRPLFEQAKADFSRGDYADAADTFKDLIKDYPESPCREEAMWLRAEALFARERYYKAYEQYEDLIEQYAGSNRYQDALRREIEIAELYLGPVRRRVLGIPLMSGDAEAIEILRRVYEHQPSGDLADDVVLRIADYYWSKRRWPDAEEYYDKYCREYPNGEAIRHAEFRRACCAIERCKGPRYETTTLRLAVDRLKQFQAKYPQEAARRDVPGMLERLRDLQAQSLYEIAARYRRAGHPCAAAFYAEQLRKRYPGSPWSEKAVRFLVTGPEPASPVAEAAQQEQSP